MRKNFLILMLMALLPLAGWAADVTRITVTLGTINKVYGEADPAITDLDFSWTEQVEGNGSATVVTAAGLLNCLDYRRVSAGDEVNAVKYYTMVANTNKPGDWIIVVANQGVVNIMPKSLGTGDAPNTGITIADIAAIPYTGGEQKPDLAVNYTKGSFNENLEKGRDYTVEFTNNINKGTATATLTGKGNYEGTVTKTFVIGAGQFTAVFAETPNFTFSGENQTPTYTVMLGETPLTANSDYTVSYFTNADRDAAAAEQVDAKTYYVTVAGKAGTNYEGWEVKTLSYEIAKKSLADEDVTFVVSKNANRTYTGKAQTFSTAGLTLKFGNITLGQSSYTISHRNNVNVPVDDAAENKPTVIATGKGNYKDSKEAYFTISPRNLDDVAISADLEANQTYTGSKIKPSTEGKIKYTNSTPTEFTLVEEKDYTVAYGDNKNVVKEGGVVANGGTITIKGTGNYCGTVVRNFKIQPAELIVSAKDYTKGLGNADPTSAQLATGNYYEITGFVGGENATTAGVTGAPTFAIDGHTEIAGIKENVISISSVAGLSAPNYSFAIGATADLIISMASVTITATDTEETYGYVLPTLNKNAFAFTATGLNGAEEITDLTFTVKKGNVEYHAGDMLAAGEYDIIPSDAAATSPSYVFDYAPAATLTINPYKLQIEAQPQAIAYGGNPTLNDFGDTYVMLYDLNNPTTSSAAADLTRFTGVTKASFIKSLDWDVADNKPIAEPGTIVVNLQDDPENPTTQLFKNFKVTTVSGNVTYTSGVPTDLDLDDSKDDNFTKIQTFHGQRVNVTIKFNRAQELPAGTPRNWKKDCWNSLVLPFDIDVNDLSYAFKYAYFNVASPEKTVAGSVEFKLEMGITNSVIPANTPILIKTNKDLADIVDANGKINFGEQTIVAPETAVFGKEINDTHYKFCGTYTRLTVDKDNMADDYWWWYGGSQKPARITTGSANSWQIVPFACFVDQTGNTSVPASEMVFTFQDLDGSTTSIRGISADDTTNAKVYGEGWYNLNGVKLQGAPTEKGVYIQNGKKVVLK